MFLVGALIENATFPRWSDWRQLEREGQWTEATVVRRTPQDHNFCYFSYTVGNQVLEGGDHCAQFKEGAKFPVLYLPSRPSLAAMHVPRWRWLGYPIALSCWALLGGFVASFMSFQNPLRRLGDIGLRQ